MLLDTQVDMIIDSLMDVKWFMAHQSETQLLHFAHTHNKIDLKFACSEKPVLSLFCFSYSFSAYTTNDTKMCPKCYELYLKGQDRFNGWVADVYNDRYYWIGPKD